MLPWFKSPANDSLPPPLLLDTAVGEEESDEGPRTSSNVSDDGPVEDDAAAIESRVARFANLEKPQVCFAESS